MAASEATQSPELQVMVAPADHVFMAPRKMINEEADVHFFLRSTAYTDIMTFLLQLNASMFPRPLLSEGSGQHASDQDKGQHLQSSTPIAALSGVLTAFDNLIEQAPPVEGPRRFGNVSFRKWYELVEQHADKLLSGYVAQLLPQYESGPDDPNTPVVELKAYLLGSFGSAQRLDNGTGHELSFLAFLACLWKLGAFVSLPATKAEQAIVLGIIQPYLDLVRRLIKTYNLEPAGSHGVWGLDDHSFLPYIFGSAQLSPSVANNDSIPAEGSAPGAPDPGDVVRIEAVTKLRSTNLYFGAIGFIYDVKRGPFWEHSPTLYDISGVKAGWAKINKGMIKMFIGEVLSKFPVVQHFPFGSMFKWEQYSSAPSVGYADRSASKPQAPPTSRLPPPASSSKAGTSAPWATAAPRATPTGIDAGRRTATHAHTQPPPRGTPSGTNVPTKAPWAKDR